MTKIHQLNDYREKQGKISRGKNMLAGEALSKYRIFYHMALRQLGKERYKKEFNENEIGEETLFELLTSQQKKDLEEITKKLGPILRGILKRIK